jgi:hypothetical protein
VHPDLAYSIAKLRREELLAVRRFPAPAGRGRRWSFRRRRDMLAAAATPPAPIVLLPPPREERDPAGRDQRVA